MHFILLKIKNFLPMKNEKGFGLTEKFSMKIFIFSFFPKVEGECCNKLEKKLLRTGLIINTSNHEIGHNFVNNHFYMENSRIPIETPRKKTLEFAEGGWYVELALYGRILETISLEQTLYIINEENYKKNFVDFQEGFNNIQAKDLELKGAFKELFKDINLKEISSKLNKNIYISLKTSNKNRKKYIKCRIVNDVIGKRKYEKKCEEIFEKYS